MKTNKFHGLLAISLCLLLFNGCRKDSPTAPAAESMSDLMPLAGGYTNSGSTPMGIHYAGLHVTTSADRAYLSNPKNEPPAPPGLTPLFANFTVTLYPYGNPIPADINQHDIGDCDGVSALASMSYLHPGFVKSLITDNHDGTFSVLMFDPQGKRDTVVVDSKFLADNNGNIAAVSGKNNTADWATVLEKAIMKYNVIYHADDDIGGIGSESTTPLFTGDGNSFAFDRGVLTPDQLARAVRVSLAQGKFITGGFGQAISISGLVTVPGHGYAVTISSDHSALFAMRNPWGANPTVSGSLDGSFDGILNIPDTGSVLATIDLRIIEPGLAGTVGVTKAYIPPAPIQAEQVRISKRLLEKHKIYLR